jgi:alcohol dehydrogenase (cytochrome c)
MISVRSFCAAVFVGAWALVSSAQGPGGQAAPEAPMPPLLRDYKPVTAERLTRPEDDNWLMIRRTYDGWGYSPLDQITPANVSRLKPVWVFSTGEARVHEFAPLVNNGVMFVTTPNNQVIAIDAKSGNLLWRARTCSAAWIR